MKKAISVFLICSMLSAAAAAYAKDIEISSSNKKITVTAQLDPSAYGFLIAAKQGKDINDNTNVFAVLEKQSNEDGVATFVFDMPQERDGASTDGIYDVYVKQNGKTVLVGSFEYATEKSKADMCELLKNAADADSVKNIILSQDNEIVLKAMKFGVDAFRTLKEENRTAAAEEFLAKRNASMSQTELTDTLNQLIAVKGINSGDAEIETFISAANLDDGEVRYETISDAVLIKEINEYVNANKPYADTAALKDVYLQVNALYKINTARFDQMDSLLAKYSDVLKLNNDSNYTAYKNASNKSEVNKTLLNLIKRSMPKTLSQLSSYLKEAVDSTPGSSGNSGGSGGGSGSGSGSSSGNKKTESKASSAIGIPVAPAEEKKAAFNDMADYAWASEAVTALAKVGVLSGDGTGGFDGNKELTREEFITMLVKATGIYDSTAVCYHFDDVKPEDWFYPMVASAHTQNIVYGVEENRFGIGEKLTRQDLSVMVYRAATTLPDIVLGAYNGNKGLPDYVRDRKAFADDAEIADYAKDAIYELYTRGVVNGMGESEFQPKGYATKAQGAQIIYGLFYKN